VTGLDFSAPRVRSGPARVARRSISALLASEALPGWVGRHSLVS